MALNPEISLGVRPPVLQPLQIQSPLERYGKVLTLRGMMEQQQLRQMNIEQTRLENQALQQTAADDQALRNIYASGREPAEGELYATVGLKTGMTILKARQEFEKSKLDKQISNLELAGKRTGRLAQLAAGIRGPEQWKPTILQATSEEVLTPEIGRQLMESGYDPKTVERFATGALDAVQRQNFEIAELKKKRDEILFPYQQRKAIADATAAEQTVGGTQPITRQQQAQAEMQLWTTPGGLIAIMNDPTRTPADKQRARAGYEQQMRLREAGAPRLPSPGMTPEAEAQAIRVAKATQTTAPSSGEEKKAFTFYTRAQDSEDVFSDLEDQINSMGTIGQFWYNRAPNVAQSGTNQVLRQAQRQFTEARLRKESGAAIPVHEYENDAITYFPQTGDKPENLERKRLAREKVLEGLKQESGRAFVERKPPAGTIIEVNGKKYSYKGRGSTSNLGNYKEVR